MGFAVHFFDDSRMGICTALVSGRSGSDSGGWRVGTSCGGGVGGSGEKISGAKAGKCGEWYKALNISG